MHEIYHTIASRARIHLNDSNEERQAAMSSFDCEGLHAIRGFVTLNNPTNNSFSPFTRRDRRHHEFVLTGVTG
jgi:hypothetical protein